MKLIVGLGNPGADYARTRHNIGFDSLSHFARRYKIPLDVKLGHARTGRGEIQKVPVILARPYTFMNRSGGAVRALRDKFNIAPADIIVIHDDMDLPLGKLRIRLDGSSAGHKGIESIVSELGSRDFIRIRIGIGHPANGEEETRDEKEVIDYVLTHFAPEEKPVVDEVIAHVGNALLTLLTEGLETAMNRFNRTPPGASPAKDESEKTGE